MAKKGPGKRETGKKEWNWAKEGTDQLEKGKNVREKG